MLRVLLSVLAVAVPTRADAADTRLLEDVRLAADDRRLTLANAKVAVEIDAADGSLAAVRLAGREESVVTPTPDALDVRVDGVWLVAKHGARVVARETSMDPGHRYAELALRLAIGDEYELTCHYRLYPGQARLDRAARLFRKPQPGGSGGEARRLEAFAFGVPGALLGRADDARVSVPGSFFPNRFVAAGTRYDDLRGKSIRFHSAPDAGFGLFLLEDAADRRTLASWLETGSVVADHPSIRGGTDRLTFRHEAQRAHRLLPGMAVASDVHRLEVHPTRDAALAAYREACHRLMPPDAGAPAWAREAVILEAMPQYYPGGFKGLTARLPFYRKVGFNVLYLMPHWQGGYSPIDLYAVDEKLGTKADLQELVKAAHALGMRVLFDMVIHGFNEKSPIVQQRPDLFVKDGKGGLARHPAWKSVTTDWASPAYQQYLVDLVLHDLATYGIDGYRVDAQTYKGASWDPDLPYPAYRAGSAGPELLAKMLAALRAKKPDAVLLSEVFGPAYQSSCALVHDNQTEAPQFLLDQMGKGLADAATYRAHLADVYLALPGRGLANRVFFARNHDTSWFYHFNGYTPRFLAMEAVHALFGVPEVFGGDPKPKNGPSPDADPKVWDHYAKLFAVRTAYPEFARGQVLIPQSEVTADNRWVIAGGRLLDGKVAVGVVSLSDKEERVRVALHVAGAAPSRVTLTDAITGDRVDAEARDGAFELTLRPFQVLVGRM
jgi:hypothetical protein